jgi:hypothetical protein
MAAVCKAACRCGAWTNARRQESATSAERLLYRQLFRRAVDFGLPVEVVGTEL